MRKNKNKYFSLNLYKVNIIKKLKKSFSIEKLRRRAIKNVQYEYNLIDLNEYKKVNQFIFNINLFLFFLIKKFRFPFYKKSL